MRVCAGEAGNKTVRPNLDAYQKLVDEYSAAIRETAASLLSLR